MGSIQQLSEDLEKNLHRFIIENAEKIKFNESQYTIQVSPEGDTVDVLISITGLGKKHISASIKKEDGEFQIKGKILERSNEETFPFEIISQFVEEVVQSWLEPKVETSANVVVVVNPIVDGEGS